jgi:hypothetical protein
VGIHNMDPNPGGEIAQLNGCDGMGFSTFER